MIASYYIYFFFGGTLHLGWDRQAGIIARGAEGNTCIVRVVLARALLFSFFAAAAAVPGA